MTKPHDKQMSRCGRGRTTGGSSSAVGRGDDSDRGRKDLLIQEEENLERAGHTIPPGACLDTPPYLEKFDRGYIREYSEDVVMRHPVDTRAHPMLNYVGKLKMVEEARENNPYKKWKDLEVDYKFWNEFHFNFYASVIFNSKKSKIVKMQ